MRWSDSIAKAGKYCRSEYGDGLAGGVSNRIGLIL